MSNTLRIGTRASALAQAQTSMVAATLREAGVDTELVPIRSAGDRSMAPISQIGVGVFTTALRDALASGEVDVVVHSHKDLPTEPDPRVQLAAIPPREDPRDVLISRDGLSVEDLPAGAVVGTGSPRRATQLQALNPGIKIREIRGNVETRIGKVTSGECDAIVLAYAGLLRTNRSDVISQIIDPPRMLPAPAQGALAVECRIDEVDRAEQLRSILDDEVTRVAVAAERAMLAALEAGCSAPVGALAEMREHSPQHGVPGTGSPGQLTLQGVVATASGALLRATRTGEAATAQQMGTSLAAQLLADRAAAGE